MTIASRLFDVADSIRAGVVAYYETQGDAPALPADRLIANAAFSQHALDCEQFVVAVDEFGPDPGAIVSADGRSFGSYGANLTVAVVRCVPVLDEGGNPPPLADVEASAAVMLADLSLVAAALVVWATETQTCRYVNLGRCTPIGPDGGIGGVTCPVTITV